MEMNANHGQEDNLSIDQSLHPESSQPPTPPPAKKFFSSAIQEFYEQTICSENGVVPITPVGIGI